MKKILFILAMVAFLGACNSEQKNTNKDPNMENNESPSINNSDTMNTNDNTNVQ